MSKLLIVSVDGHATVPTKAYRPYVEAKYLSAFDDMLKDSASDGVDFFEVLDPEFAKVYRGRYYEDDAIDGEHDADLRVKLLAGEGIVGEIIFPNGGPWGAAGFGSDFVRYDSELVLAGVRAYNRWIVDFTSGHPQLGAQTIAFLDDVDEAVKDVYWAKEHGVKSLYMRGMDMERPLYWDRIYDPFWAACAETGLPVNFHGATGGPRWRSSDLVVPGLPYDVRSRIAITEFVFWAQRPLWFMMWSGVFERHPHLRAVFSEMHCHWAAGLIASMDHSWNNSFFNDSIKETVPRPPSEYFERQVMLGASNLAKGELAVGAKESYRHKMMFGADFPHPESTYPYTREYLRATVGNSDMTEPEIRAFMGEMAAEFFDFDLSALRPLADEHGLEISEITEPLPADEEKRLFGKLDPGRPTTSLTYSRA